MCGIVGYVGERSCRELLLHGPRAARVPRLRLRRPVAARATARSSRCARSATSQFLSEAVDASRSDGGAVATAESEATTGIGHTRWATHGRVTEPNAHPHSDCDGPRPHRPQRDRRELRRAARAAGGRGRRLHLRDRRRGRRAPDRAPLRRRPGRGRPRRLPRAARPLRVRRDARRRARRPGRRAQGVPAGRRRRRGRALHRLRDPRLPAADAQRQASSNDDEIVVIRPEGAQFLDAAPASRSSARSPRSTGTTTPPRRAASRPSCSRRSTSSPTPSPRRSPTASHGDGVDLGDIRHHRRVLARRAPDRDRRLRHLVPRRPRRPLRDRGVGARAGRDGHRLRVPLPQPGRRERRPRRSASRSRARRPTRWPRCAWRASAARRCWRSPTSWASQATRDADGVLFTRAGLEIGVAATKTFVAQVAAMYLLGAEARAGARHAAGRARSRELIAELRALPHKIAELLESIDEHDRRDRRPVVGRGLLPLPRPPRRPAGRARGRAEAEGDLLHPDRRLRRRRDEARPDRAARRAHAGRDASPPTRRCSTRCSRTSPRCGRAART